MWTNIFRLVGFQRVSWFQFLPHDSDSNSSQEARLISSISKSAEVDENDYARFLVVRSHLQLQKEGFFSTWTNSFCGPWDPSQGIYNPDDRIKLWLFVPGCHLTVLAGAQAALSGLRGVASGIWSAPGDSEELSFALSQALRNHVERALSGYGYTRFGDVFSRCHPFGGDEDVFRKGQPTVEFIFSVTEEAIFVHVILSAKRIRAISMGDVDRLLNQSNSHQKLAVIVSPHGMHGSLSGCAPVDLVKQSCHRTLQGESDVTPSVLRRPSCQMFSPTCHVEVTLGRGTLQAENMVHLTLPSSMPKYHVTESQKERNSDHRGAPDCHSNFGRTFTYPLEAVAVPSVQLCSMRTSLKRFWLQNWVGPSSPGSYLFMHREAVINDQFHWKDPGSVEADVANAQSQNRISDSNSSSFSGSTSSSSGSAYKVTASNGDLDADADSVMCRQSVMGSVNLLESDHKLGVKRPRPEAVGTLNHASAVVKVPGDYACRSGLGSSEANSSIVTGIHGDQRSHWDWDDDDKGIGMDIHTLLSEFGDFGDFFENDNLPFGEPPGTAESEALICSTQDYPDMGGSPCGGVMDVPEFLSTGFSSLESFNTLVPSVADECLSKNEEAGFSSLTTFTEGVNAHSQPSESGTDHVMTEEALLSFSSEYGAVEAPMNDFSSSIFRNPYAPACWSAEDMTSKNGYSYSSTSVPVEKLEDKPYPSQPEHSAQGLFLQRHYTCVQTGNKVDNEASTRPHTGTLPDTSKPPGVFRVKLERTGDSTDDFPLRSAVSHTEVDRIFFQAFMCRFRHTVRSSADSGFAGFARLAGMDSGVNHSDVEPCAVPNEDEVRKKGQMPDRIVNDLVPGRFLNMPVGVWRSVSSAKHVNPVSGARSPFPHNSYGGEECLLASAEPQPLQELLDGLPLLVQQATSFVDLSLDSDYGDGVYGVLALMEQQGRLICCGPSMLHAGCGGILSSSHSLDVSGFQLADPFSAPMQPSAVINLLQLEMKAALKSAFGALDGPLSVSEWCGHIQSGDAAFIADGCSPELVESEGRNYCTATSISKSESSVMSPSLSLTVGAPSTAVRGPDDACQRKELEPHPEPRSRKSLHVLLEPSILVGYQDDWLKTSTASLQIWEKAPLEPYAMQKPVTYCVVCPDIDPLTSAAADFFLQLGSVYEMCNLGAHVPQVMVSEAGDECLKVGLNGFVLLDCPQSMKIEGISDASLVGCISDYLLSLSNGWDLQSFLRSLTRSLKALKLVAGTKDAGHGRTGSSSSSSSIMVVYVVCPYPDAAAVLHTVVRSCVALGSSVLPNDTDRRLALSTQVGKALSNSGASSVTDEASVSLVTLSGFSCPKLVLQIVTLECVFRVTSPSLPELVLLKDIAFTVYNKARRVPRWTSTDTSRPTAAAVWKDYAALTTVAAWDNQTSSAWQNMRIPSHDEYRNNLHHVFEPLFILAEPVVPETVAEKKPSLHCCYGWTEDWRWMICVWTDSRGELLDSHVFPFAGISSRQDTKGLQCLFVHVLQQGCQLLQSCSAADSIPPIPRDFIIARVGFFYDLEYQEWQKAFHAVVGGGGASDAMRLRQCRTPAAAPKAGGRKAPPLTGLFRWIQSVSLVTVLVDRTLQLGLPTAADASCPVHIAIPSPSVRFMVQPPLQLPTCLTAESPPLAHLLHSKGTAVPLATAFVASRAVSSARCGVSKDWPSVLAVALVDYCGDSSFVPAEAGGDAELWAQAVLEPVAAQLHALSWMTVSPAYVDRRTPLPFHCDALLRMRRLLHFMDVTVSKAASFSYGSMEKLMDMATTNVHDDVTLYAPRLRKSPEHPWSSLMPSRRARPRLESRATTLPH